MNIIYLLKNKKNDTKVFVPFLKLDVRIIYFVIHLSATRHSIKQLFEI